MGDRNRQARVLERAAPRGVLEEWEYGLQGRQHGHRLPVPAEPPALHGGQLPLPREGRGEVPRVQLHRGAPQGQRRRLQGRAAAGHGRAAGGRGAAAGVHRHRGRPDGLPALQGRRPPVQVRGQARPRRPCRGLRHRGRRRLLEGEELMGCFLGRERVHPLEARLAKGRRMRNQGRPRIPRREGVGRRRRFSAPGQRRRLGSGDCGLVAFWHGGRGLRRRPPLPQIWPTGERLAEP
mmetsp:Transcript_4352/g.11590  ORF Transcript_4352/g.11590 Transcript_4352/m.11590 type:complete len:236 (-) Transcript_4352:19-726(-)